MNVLQQLDGRAAGYARLIEKYSLAVPQPYHLSAVRVSDTRPRTTSSLELSELESFPPSFWPGDDDYEHLRFALKYDGLDLAVLKAYFRACDPSGLASSIRNEPTSKYARKIWYLYELLSDKTLDIQGANVKYEPLLNPDRYFTSSSVRSRRHRVDDNLLGGAGFCPIVRKPPVREFVEKRLDEKARRVLEGVSPSVLI